MSDSGENACMSDSGENASMSDSGENACMSDSGENASMSDSGEDASMSDSGENACSSSLCCKPRQTSFDVQHSASLCQAVCTGCVGLMSTATCYE
jgi:hypothetical protein